MHPRYDTAVYACNVQRCDVFDAFARGLLLDCARLLLRAGASPLATPKSTRAAPPLFTAVAGMNVPLCELMLQHVDRRRTDWWWLDARCTSVLHLLVFSCTRHHARLDMGAFPQLVRMLTSRGASLTRADAAGLTPLARQLMPEYCALLQ